jgi:hypothetical protein
MSTAIFREKQASPMFNVKPKRKPHPHSHQSRSARSHRQYAARRIEPDLTQLIEVRNVHDLARTDSDLRGGIHRGPGIEARHGSAMGAGIRVWIERLSNGAQQLCGPEVSRAG